MDETQLRLDGNACAGLLREIFGRELTAARGACASCGNVAQIGSLHLYGYPQGPGAVIRCSACENVVMVLVHAGARYRLAVQGFSWIEIADSDGNGQGDRSDA
jgi:hypothetical protein